MRTVIAISILVLAACNYSPRAEMDRLYIYAHQALQKGDLDAAERGFKAAIVRAKALPDYYREFDCERGLSDISARRQDFAGTEKWLRTGLETLQDPKHEASPLPALEALNYFYEHHGTRGQKIQNLRALAEFWRTTFGADSSGTARYEAELGEALFGNGEYAAAEPPLRSSLAVFERNGFPFALAAARARRDLSADLYFVGKTDEMKTLDAAQPRDAVKRDLPNVKSEAISRVEPERNDTAGKFRVHGSVRLSLDVDEKGHPQNIQIDWPIGAGLDESAIKAVEGWQFQPALKNGIPVSDHTMAIVSF